MLENLQYQSFKISPSIPSRNSGYRSTMCLAKTIACALYLSSSWRQTPSFCYLLPRSTRQSLPRSLRHMIAQFSITAAQLRRRGSSCPQCAGVPTLWKGRAITQYVTPRPRPLWATSTPFVHGIRKGDPGGLLPMNQASQKIPCSTWRCFSP